MTFYFYFLFLSITQLVEVLFLLNLVQLKSHYNLSEKFLEPPQDMRKTRNLELDKWSMQTVMIMRSFTWKLTEEGMVLSHGNDDPIL